MGCYKCYFFDDYLNVCRLAAEAEVDYMRQKAPFYDYEDCDSFESREGYFENEIYEG